MKKSAAIAVSMVAALMAGSAMAQTAAPVQDVKSWMHKDVGEAWASGYKGKGATVTIVDDFTGQFGRSTHDIGYGVKTNTHGQWVRDMITGVAPEAATKTHSMSTSASYSKVSLAKGLNVINGSYGIYAPGKVSQAHALGGLYIRDKSVANAAIQGTAVVVKAAGNDNIAMGDMNRSGYSDYLSVAMKNGKSVIFAGALNSHGTPEAQATKASYSNFAGGDKAFQDRYLMVGVEGDKTGLYGTSFAAPQLSAYAAIVGSKFTTATPTKVANQLLTTARTDTIAGYTPTIHGRGEASLSRALAPVAIQ